MAIMSETLKQSRTLPPQHMLPIIGASVPGKAIERRW
jgi:hypothetical protein